MKKVGKRRVCWGEIEREQKKDPGPLGIRGQLAPYLHPDRVAELCFSANLLLSLEPARGVEPRTC